MIIYLTMSAMSAGYVYGGAAKVFAAVVALWLICCFVRYLQLMPAMPWPAIDPMDGDGLEFLVWLINMLRVANEFRVRRG